MKKTFLLKSWMLMVLAAGFVMAGCSSDDDDPQPAVDNRADVVGTYPVKITVSGPMQQEVYTDLVLTKEGDANLKASALVAAAPMGGNISIDLVLSSLKEFTPETRAIPTGYDFKIAEQNITVIGAQMAFKGTGKNGGNDGKVYKTSAESFISFEIISLGDDTQQVTVKVESGTEPVIDNRDDVVGTYPVKVTVGGMVDMTLYTDLTLAKEGDEDLKGVASVAVPGFSNININLVFSSIEEYEPESRALPTGYKFKIAEQNVDAFGAPMKFKGAGLYGDYDGKVQKTASDSEISFEIAGPGGSVTVKVESGTEPADE